MTKLAILQPSYIPWLGYFEQISKVDIFVFYDDVQYTKNDWRNRNKIKTANGECWLTVPVYGSTSTNIKDVEIDNKTKWQDKHYRAITQNYSKTPFFKDILPILDNIYKQKWTLLEELSITFIKDICNFLEIKTNFYKSSELKITGDKNQRLINICKHFKATEYYSGKAAESYLDFDLFKASGIDIKLQNYNHPIYKQLYGEFIPFLSILDLLCNCGNESLSILKGGING